MRLAVLTDIHGNLPALEAVIADFTRAGANAWSTSATSSPARCGRPKPPTG